MEHGPLPPHERAWRHPAELAAEEQAVLRAETAPSSSRAFALTTGTIGLLAIAVLVIAVTPSGHDQPIAVSATTAPAASAPAASPTQPVRSALTRRQGAPAAAMQPALATPIGDGDYALVAEVAVAHDDDGEVAVVLPSGAITDGEVVERTPEMVVVRLAQTAPGHAVAEQRPRDREVVKIMSEPPVTVAFADLAELDAATLELLDGTAVVDDEGQLIGLCTESIDGRGVHLIEVDADLQMDADDADAGTVAVAAHDPAVADGASRDAAPEPAGEPTDDD